MIDDDQLALLIYQHVVQLTLLDHPMWEAFDIAHRAAAAFDDEFTRLGLEKARAELRKSKARIISSNGGKAGEDRNVGAGDKP